MEIFMGKNFYQINKYFVLFSNGNYSDFIQGYNKYKQDYIYLLNQKNIDFFNHNLIDKSTKLHYDNIALFLKEQGHIS